MAFHYCTLANCTLNFLLRPAHATKASPDPHHTTHSHTAHPPTQLTCDHSNPICTPLTFHQPNSSPDQSCLNPNHTDHMYVLNMSSRGFWIGATSCKSVLINLVFHFTEILPNSKSLESLPYCKQHLIDLSLKKTHIMRGLRKPL